MIKQFILDAFTDKLFSGNQAAVCVLDGWIPDELMMKIAKENNFSETAFVVKCGNDYHLHWFTPGGEISLCGHATLATSYVLFNFYEKSAQKIVYNTLSGKLCINRQNDYIILDFPVFRCDNEVVVTEQMGMALGVMPQKAYLDRDLLLIYDDESIIRKMKPNFELLKQFEGHGVGVTAPGKDYDCVSRFFVPKFKVNEDPVTGTIHCMIAPYWAAKLGKSTINAYQASERGGKLCCSVYDGRVKIAGCAVLYSVSTLQL